MAALILSALRLFIFIRDYKDGYKKGKGRIYVVNQYYNAAKAASGAVLNDLCESLAQDGYDVRVLASKTSAEIPNSEIVNNVYIERLCIIPEGNSLITKMRGYTKYFFKVWFRFLKVRRKSTILVLTTPPLVGLIPVIWKPFKEFKVIYSIMDLYPDVFDVLNIMKKSSFVYKFLGWIEHTIISKSDYVVAIGNSMRKRITMYYGNDDKIVVIQNRALKEQRKYSEKKISIGKSEKCFVIQYAGNLGRVHEFQTVLGALELLKQKGIEDVKFQFIGGGFNYDKFKSLVEKSKMEYIEFLPYISRTKIVDFLIKSDVQLVISKSDLLDTAFPSKFYGIIAVGKPMIYICEGEDDITEYIEKYKIGFRVSNGDSNGLLEKILLLKNSPELLENLSNNALSLHKKIDLDNDNFRMYKMLFDKVNEPGYTWKPVENIFAIR